MNSSTPLIILYPTDTLYALGVDATDAQAVSLLKELKGRGEGKAISIAVDSIEMMEEYAEVTPLAERLIEAFLPGKLTLILQAKCAMSGHCTLAAGVVGEDGSVGVRMIDRPEVMALIHELGRPITATSANVSGMPTERTSQNILEQFGDKAPRITRVIDAGELPPSEPSTVVDARGNEPIIIRSGAISRVALYKALGYHPHTTETL